MPCPSRGVLGLSVLGALAASAGPAAAQRPPPVIEKSWCGPEGRGAINFSIRLTDANAFSRVWFDLGLRPDLSDASKVGEQVTPERYGASGYGERVYEFAPQRLRPNTTYYCRARILTSFGHAQSEIQSFTTKP
jgi:hypothetical protein